MALAVTSLGFSISRIRETYISYTQKKNINFSACGFSCKASYRINYHRGTTQIVKEEEMKNIHITYSSNV
jgi:hypothetical protein